MKYICAVPSVHAFELAELCAHRRTYSAIPNIYDQLHAFERELNASTESRAMERDLWSTHTHLQTHTHTRIHTHSPTHTYTSYLLTYGTYKSSSGTSTHTYTHTPLRTHTHLHTHTHTHLHTPTHTYTYLHTQMDHLLP